MMQQHFQTPAERIWVKGGHTADWWFAQAVKKLRNADYEDLQKFLPRIEQVLGKEVGG